MADFVTNPFGGLRLSNAASNSNGSGASAAAGSMFVEPALSPGPHSPTGEEGNEDGGNGDILLAPSEKE
jgi:hypothetical protein